METKNFNNSEEMSAERSLQLISETIERSRRVMTINSGNSFLAWGVVVAATALVIGHLWEHCGGPNWNLLWLTVFVTGPLANRLLTRKGLPENKTHIGKIIGRAYFILGILCALIGFCTGILVHYISPEHVAGSVIASTSLLIGVGAAFTGSVLKNTLIMVAGALGGLSGYFGSYFFTGSHCMMLYAGVAVITMVVPGLIIKLKNR